MQLLVHRKNIIGLSQFHLQYQTLHIQADQLHCWTTVGPVSNYRHAGGCIMSISMPHAIKEL